MAVCQGASQILLHGPLAHCLGVDDGDVGLLLGLGQFEGIRGQSIADARF